MLNWSHQLGLSQPLKVTDPKTLCAVVSFFEMPYGTKILFFPLIYEGMEIISVLSRFKGFQSCVVKDMKHAKISVLQGCTG